MNKIGLRFDVPHLKLQRELVGGVFAHVLQVSFKVIQLDRAVDTADRKTRSVIMNI